MNPSLFTLNKQLAREKARFRTGRVNLYLLLVLMLVFKVMIYTTVPFQTTVIMWCFCHALLMTYSQYVSCNERKSWSRYDGFMLLYIVKQKDGEITAEAKAQYERDYDNHTADMKKAEIALHVCSTLISIIIYACIVGMAIAVDSLMVPVL
ncbi:MAG: hypothetical protein ACRC3J_05720 [Culicoidibacterales bacterium]